jgi:Cdc6-like AAA superfamily ATPase
MTIDEKIRQLQRGTGQTPVQERDSLSPVAHVDEPVARETVVHALFSYLEPAFDGQLPPNAYVWGPKGSGKSAVLTAVFRRLRSDPSRSSPRTTPHEQDAETPTFLYVDARRVSTRFGLFRAVLDGLIEESIPDRGVETATLRGRIRAELAAPERRLVLAVDHVDEPETFSVGALASMLEPFESSIAWLSVGRAAPTTIDGAVSVHCLHVPAYRGETLAEVLRARANAGLDSEGITGDQIARIAEWADGNAHDGLAALTGAAGLAADRGRTQIHTEDLVDALSDIPQPSVSLARILALPQNHRCVLHALVEVDDADRESVATATTAIAAEPGIGLSERTIERFLYELAETGIIERVRRSRASGRAGRPPSRLELRFSPTVFEQLSEPVETV